MTGSTCSSPELIDIRIQLSLTIWLSTYTPTLGSRILSCYPGPGAKFGKRWATLATVIIEPALGRLRILDGTPLDVRRIPWRTLDARALSAVASK